MMLVRTFLATVLCVVPMASGTRWPDDLSTRFLSYFDSSNRETAFGLRFDLSGESLTQPSESANLASSFCTFLLVPVDLSFGLRWSTFFGVTESIFFAVALGFVSGVEYEALEELLTFDVSSGLYPPYFRKVLTMPAVASFIRILPSLYSARYARNLLSILSATDELEFFDGTADAFRTGTIWRELDACEVLMLNCVDDSDPVRGQP